MNENYHKNLNEIRFEKVYKRLALIPTEIFAAYGGFIAVEGAESLELSSYYL